MKLKKAIISFLVVGAMLFSLAACGKEGEKSSESGSGSESGGKLGSVCVVLPSPRGDSGTMDSVCKGVERLQKVQGFEMKIVEIGDYATEPAKLEAALLDISDDGWDIIVSCGSALNDILTNVCPKYENTKYLIFDTTFDFAKYPLKNVYSGSFMQNEGAYLAGALAASMSESGKIGFVGGVENPVINDFLWGYVEGAQHVKEDIKMNISYTMNWADSAKAKELALTQISMGADVIFPAAGPASNGAMDAGKEKKTWLIGVDIDRAEQYKADPEMVAYILSSSLKNVDVAAERALKKIADGSLTFGKHEELGIKEGCVGLAKNANYEKLVPTEVREKLDAIEQEIIDGKIKVGTAIGKSADEIATMKSSVA